VVSGSRSTSLCPDYLGPPRCFAGRLDLKQRKPGVIEKDAAGRAQIDPPRVALQQ
jgi:hypothetical protein